jgi:hypothetical protein
MDCPKVWDYDRGGLPCAEPTRWNVTDQQGTTTAMCDGHARTALVGSRIVPVATARKGRP